MSKIPKQDAIKGEVHASTRSAEATHPTHNNAEASGTISPSFPHKGERKEPVTHPKGREKPKLQQQHLYKRVDKQERSQPNFVLVLILLKKSFQ